LSFRVLRFRSDGDVGVGVFPKRKEILLGGLGERTSWQ